MWKTTAKGFTCHDMRSKQATVGALAKAIIANWLRGTKPHQKHGLVGRQEGQGSCKRFCCSALLSKDNLFLCHRNVM